MSTLTAEERARAKRYKNSFHRADCDNRRTETTVSIRKRKKRAQLKLRRSGAIAPLSQDAFLAILDSAFTDRLLSSDEAVCRHAVVEAKQACAGARESETTPNIDVLIGSGTLACLTLLLQNVHLPLDIQQNILWVLVNISAGTSAHTQSLVVPRSPRGSAGSGAVGSASGGRVYEHDELQIGWQGGDGDGDGDGVSNGDLCFSTLSEHFENAEEAEAMYSFLSNGADREVQSMALGGADAFADAGAGADVEDKTCICVLMELIGRVEDAEVLQSILMCFANIAVDSAMLRDVLLNAGLAHCITGLRARYHLLQDQAETTRYFSILLCNLYQTKDRQPEWQMLTPLHDLLVERFLAVQCAETTCYLLQALYSVTGSSDSYDHYKHDDADADGDGGVGDVRNQALRAVFTVPVCERLHHLVTSMFLGDAPHARHALRVLGNLCSLETPVYTQCFIESGAVTHLAAVLCRYEECGGADDEERNSWLTEICFIAGNLAAGTTAQAVALFASSLTGAVTGQLRSAVSRRLRRQAAQTLDSIAARSYECLQRRQIGSVHFLVEANLAAAACEQLVTHDVFILSCMLNVLDKLIRCAQGHTVEVVLASRIAIECLQNMAAATEQNEVLARRALAFLERLDRGEHAESERMECSIASGAPHSGSQPWGLFPPPSSNSERLLSTHNVATTTTTTTTTNAFNAFAGIQLTQAAELHAPYTEMECE